MSTIFACGAECKIIASAATTSHLSLNVTAPAIETTTINPGGGAASFHWVGSGSSSASIFHVVAQNTFSARAYVRVHAYPSVTMIISQCANANGRLWITMGSTGLISLQVEGSAGAVSTGVSLSLDTWYRFDWKGDASTGTTTATLTIDGASSTSDSHAQSSANFTSVGVGANVLATAGTAPDIYWDDWVIAALADYPIGAGYIQGYVPVQDGSHNTGAAGNFTNAAGTNITNATTDAWTYLDELPPTSTDRVEQRLDTGGTVYVETRLNPASGTPIGVEAVAVYRGATSSSCTGSIKLRDSAGATEANVFSGAIASATDLLTSTHFNTIPGGGAWTSTAFAALRFRVGYGTDVTPDIWFGGTLIEAAFAPAAVSVTPGLATLTTTRFTPTVQTPRLVTPGLATLTTTRFTPTVTTPRLATPGKATLTLTRFTPTVTAPQLSSPGLATLTTTRFTPTVTVAAGVVVTPGTASLTTTRFTPTVQTPRLSIPGVRALTTTRFTPAVLTPRLVTPGTASLVSTRYTPTVTATGQAGPSRIQMTVGTSAGEPVNY